jgi:protease II
MNSRDQKVLKFKEIPGNFNSSEYTLERTYAPIAKEHKVSAPFDVSWYFSPQY